MEADLVTEGNRLEAFGRHLLVEYKNCDRTVLNDETAIQGLMEAAALASETTIVQSVFHPFFPQGISGVVVIEESHLSIHTWPEYGYAAVDFFTCGHGLPERAHEVIREGLKAGSCEVMLVHRGQIDGTQAITVQSHRVEEMAENSTPPSPLWHSQEDESPMVPVSRAGESVK